MQKLNLNEMKIVAAGRGKPDKAPQAKSPASSSKGTRDADRNSGGSEGGSRCNGSITADREGNITGFSFSCRAY